MSWHYLSFATDDEFLGGVLVDAPNMIAATATAHALGINPGGQVAGVVCPEPPPEEWCNRLLTRDDLEAFDRAMGFGDVA